MLTKVAIRHWLLKVTFRQLGSHASALTFRQIKALIKRMSSCHNGLCCLCKIFFFFFSINITAALLTEHDRNLLFKIEKNHVLCHVVTLTACSL